MADPFSPIWEVASFAHFYASPIKSLGYCHRSGVTETLPCGVCEMLRVMKLLSYGLTEMHERCACHQDSKLARISTPHCGLQQVGGREGTQVGGVHLGVYHFIFFK